MTPGTLEQISLFLLIVQDSEEAAAGEVVGVWWHHFGCRAQSQIVISEAAGMLPTLVIVWNVFTN